MRILVTGCDGYCGWPIVLKLIKNGHQVIGVDNGYRRQWVNEVGGLSLLPIMDMTTRERTLKEVFPNARFSYHHVDLTIHGGVVDLIDKYNPDVVLHLAAQPSAPFSQMSGAHCNFTQYNNTQILRSLIWAIKEKKLNTHLVATTTTGIYGAPQFNIPEGNLTIKGVEYPFPSMAGSWYHMSHAHNSDNLWLAAKQFDFPISEIRTSIVSGSSTEETRMNPRLCTRFDVDFYFGVVINRFVMMAMTGHRLQVYGKGEQLKPLISLEDMARSCVACCEMDVSNRKQYEIYNQLEQPIQIVELATWVKEIIEERFNQVVKLEHVPNPRIEDEQHKMVIDNKKFILDLCDSQIHQTVRGSIEQMVNDLYSHKNKFTDFMKR